MLKAGRLLLVAAIGTAVVLTVPASAQFRDWQDQNRWGWQDRGYDRDDREAYRDGYRDAQRDREHNGRYHPRGNRWKGDDRRAYDAGYRAGFNGGYGNRDRDWDRDRDRDRDHDGRWGNAGDWGYNNGGYGYGRRGGPGGQIGYQDGFRYGQHDRSVGKAFKPTDSQAYGDADHGYNSSYGSRDTFKQEYRQGYQQGYQDGYYGRGGRRY